MFDAEIVSRAETLIGLYRERRLSLGTAESCTGGLVAGLITSVAGSSDIFERGFVTYSNAAKAECLGVDAALLERFGAVSMEVAAAMAVGVLAKSPVDIAISVTGIAGPGGGSPAKPVGLVYFGMARRAADARTVEKRFGDIGRAKVRAASVTVALDLMFQAVE